MTRLHIMGYGWVTIPAGKTLEEVLALLSMPRNTPEHAELSKNESVLTKSITNMAKQETPPPPPPSEPPPTTAKKDITG